MILWRLFLTAVSGESWSRSTAQRKERQQEQCGGTAIARRAEPASQARPLAAWQLKQQQLNSCRAARDGRRMRQTGRDSKRGQRAKDEEMWRKTKKCKDPEKTICKPWLPEDFQRAVKSLGKRVSEPTKVLILEACARTVPVAPHGNAGDCSSRPMPFTTYKHLVQPWASTWKVLRTWYDFIWLQWIRSSQVTGNISTV